MTGADLVLARLQGLNLVDANFYRCKLEGATLQGPMLIQNVNLSQSNLTNSRLELILLKNVSLAGTDLRNADLSMIMMMNVDFDGANLEHIKYDEFTLQNLLNSRLNKTNMSEGLKKDLDRLRGQMSR